MTALGLGDIAPLPVRRAAGRRARSPTASGCWRSSARSTTAGDGRPRRDAAHGHRPHSSPRCRSTRAWRGWSLEADAPRLPARGARHRRRPVDPGPARAAAGQAGAGRRAARAGSPTSTRDFLALLNLWHYLKEQQKELSGSAFRRMCKAEYLHYLRVREWQDLHSQLRRPPGRRARPAPREPRATRPDADRIHQALLAGLLSHIGLRDVAQARVPRRPRRPVRHLARLGAVPASSRTWVMVGRARRDHPAVGARQRPHRPGVGRAAGRAPGQAQLHRAALVAQARAPPWPPSGSRCTACRSSPAARSHYARVDPEESRDLFIRHALVEGDWDTHHRVLPRQPARSSSGSASSRSGPGAATSSSTTRTLVGVLRRAHARRRRVRAPLRRVVEGGRPRDSPTC